MKRAISLAVACVLAACTSDPAAQGGAQVDGDAGKQPANPSVAADANPNCHMLNRPVGRLRAGDNVPLHMQVVNTSTWCFSGFGLSGVDSSGSTVVNQPSNGELRMFAKGEGVVFGYRPKPGFAGSDSFLIAMPSGFGYEINLAVSVSVAPKR